MSYESNFDQPENDYNNFGVLNQAAFIPKDGNFVDNRTMQEVVMSTKTKKNRRGLDLDTRAGNFWSGLKNIFSKKDDEDDEPKKVKSKKTTRRTSNKKITADIQPSDASDEKLPLLKQKILMEKIIAKATGNIQPNIDDVVIPKVQREQTMQEFIMTTGKKDNTLLYIAAGGLLLLLIANKKK